MQQAELGIEALRKEVDTLIIIPNDRLLQLSNKSISLVEAFKTADDILLKGVGGITDIITTPGLINLDFADVKSVMEGAGGAFMGIGKASGENRAVVAAEAAISSPLLEASIEGARGVLLSVAGGSDLGLFEVNDAARLVQKVVHPDAHVIFGANIDEKLGDEVRVTVVAAGFDSGAPAFHAAKTTEFAGNVAAAEAAAEPVGEAVIPDWISGGSPVPAAEEPSIHNQPTQRVVVFDDFDNEPGKGIDVPDFLR
jgi:cell division protein FtsZ